MSAAKAAATQRRRRRGARGHDADAEEDELLTVRAMPRSTRARPSPPTAASRAASSRPAPYAQGGEGDQRVHGLLPLHARAVEREHRSRADEGASMARAPGRACPASEAAASVPGRPAEGRAGAPRAAAAEGDERGEDQRHAEAMYWPRTASPGGPSSRRAPNPGRDVRHDSAGRVTDARSRSPTPRPPRYRCRCRSAARVARRDHPDGKREVEPRRRRGPTRDSDGEASRRGEAMGRVDARDTRSLAGSLSIAGAGPLRASTPRDLRCAAPGGPDRCCGSAASRAAECGTIGARVCQTPTTLPRRSPLPRRGGRSSPGGEEVRARLS